MKCCEYVSMTFINFRCNGIRCLCFKTYRQIAVKFAASLEMFSVWFQLAIRVPELILVLTSLFETLREEEGPKKVDSKLCTELTLNFLLNVYDGSRTAGQIRVFSFKLAVLALCRGPLTEKFIHLFNLASAGSESQRIDPRQLGLLLYDCIQVPKLLGEVAAFGGSNVEPSVRSCFTFNQVPML